MRAGVDPSSLAIVGDLAIDQEYLRRVVVKLTSIGSSAVGFRNTGTPEDLAVASFVSGEMQAMGLTGVAVEQVEVDAWRFESATLTLPGPTGDRGAGNPTVNYPAVSFGGVPPTPADGVTAHLVDIGDGSRRILDTHDLRGALVLLDWRHDQIHPSAVALELTERGVVGLIVNCPANGPWYQTPGALGAFDAHWPTGAPPMILIAGQDALALRHSKPQTVTVTLTATLSPRARGNNVVGYLAGELPGPIVVGAHHDAWFAGAFDNTSGVAAMLAMAKALIGSGHRPRHTICFTSRTAEEYGIAESTYDWCIGAWEQVRTTHPEWSTESPFHLCVEATGHRELRSVIEAPVELATWARRIGRAAQQQGWTPTGWRVAPPVAGTEQWPFLVSGIPGVACYAWETRFGRTDYHTQFDTIELLDFDILAAQTRLYALLLIEADRDPDAIIDHTARARQLKKIAALTDHAVLAGAAEHHASARGRTDFTEVGRSQFALDVHSVACYPHEQSLRDRRALAGVIAALDDGDRKGAARIMRSVGRHFLFPYLGPTAFGTYQARFEPESVTRTWAGSSHLPESLDLWPEFASLMGENSSRSYGPWVRASLVRAHEKVERQLVQRLNAMARSVSSSGHHSFVS